MKAQILTIDQISEIIKNFNAESKKRQILVSQILNKSESNKNNN